MAQYHLEQTEADSAFSYIQSHERIADTIVIHLNDPEKELDLAACYAQSESGAHLLPLAIDEQARSITFAFPDEIISIYLSGEADKVLQITLRPDAS